MGKDVVLGYCSPGINSMKALGSIIKFNMEFISQKNYIIKGR